MPDTARELLLRVDEKVDERRLPSKSTAAAAAYLRDAYDQLQSWPLAVTSYNYGLNGTLRAVDAVGSRHLGDILEQNLELLGGYAAAPVVAKY